MNRLSPEQCEALRQQIGEWPSLSTEQVSRLTQLLACRSWTE